MAIRDDVLSFYNELERISEEWDELTDTDVREAIHVTLNYHFVWGKPIIRLPINYGMFSEKGDQAVSRAVSTFLSSARLCAEAEGLPEGQARLDALQDETLATNRGRTFDYYIGQSDEPLPPEAPHKIRFEHGDYR